MTKGYQAHNPRDSESLNNAHDADGKSYMQTSDHGDYRRAMGEKQAIMNILY